MTEETKRPEDETPETVNEAPETVNESPAEETKGKEEKGKEKKKKEKTFTFTETEVQKLEAAARELEEVKSKQLYLLAEYDNYRKRTAKEKESIYRDAVLDTVGDFLPVYDNLERALAGLEEGDPHRQGIELIFKQFKDSLEKRGVREMDALGQPFDPEKMNAVMHIDDENLGENVVAEVFQKGFAMGDKVLRFAMVKVAN